MALVFLWLGYSILFIDYSWPLSERLWVKITTLLLYLFLRTLCLARVSWH